MSKGNLSSSYIICFFQYILTPKKFEKKYNKIFLDYQKDYLENNFYNLLEKDEQLVTYMQKNLLELFILFLLSNKEIEQGIKQHMINYLNDK